MKDGALLLVVGIVVVGAGWLLVHMGAFHPSPSPAVIVQPKAEGVKASPKASTPVRSQRESKPVKLHGSEVFTVTMPIAPSGIDRIVPLVAAAAPVAVPPAAVSRFPTVDEIRAGAEKPQIKEIFGDPALSALTTHRGHDLETFVYARNRGQSIAVICFEDGKVTAAGPQRPPFSPTNLQATAISPTQVDLTWTNNAEDATAVLVEVLTSASSARYELGPAQTLTNTTVLNLQPNTSYTFRVRARNAVGYSEYSRPATVTPALASNSFGR